MSLFFPTEKYFYKADNLFKHDFLLRQSFDTVDLLWYRTHEPLDRESEQQLHGLDEADLTKIERTVDNCPDNELEAVFQETLKELIDLQGETEIFDFYYEFYYLNLADMVKDEMLIQRRNSIVHDLRVIEADELSSDYEKFWDYVYEKTALKAMISPEVWDTNVSVSNAQQPIKKYDNTRNKTLSDMSDVTITKAKHDEMSLMNARFLLQQLKDKGLEEDRLTYVNVFAEGEEDEDVEAEFSSSGTLSTELEASTSLEASGSKLTEISFEKDSPIECDMSSKDPFKDRSFDSLYYMARRIHEHLRTSSDAYFSEAPIILLENDLVLEMKDREFKYMSHYNKIMNQNIVKIVDKDGNEGFNSRAFRRGLLKVTDELVSQMEKIRQEGVVTTKSTTYYSEFTYNIMRAPKVELSDYRKLVNFDMKTEEAKGVGLKRKIKHFKTMVCLAGRTKLRRYDYSEKITSELNNIRFPIQKVATLTKTAREHATLTVNGYLETLVKLMKKKMFYEDYPDDMYGRMHKSVCETKFMLMDVEELKKLCTAAKEQLTREAVFKPLGNVREAEETSRGLDPNVVRWLKSLSEQSSEDLSSGASKLPCYMPGLNLILTKKGKTFEKTVLPSALETNMPDHIFTGNGSYFETHGFPKQLSTITRNHSKTKE